MEKELTLGKIVIDEDMLERVMRKVMREIASEQENVVSDKINSSMTVDMPSTADLNRSRKSDDISEYIESSKMPRPAGFQMAGQDRRTTREYEALKEAYQELQEKYNQMVTNAKEIATEYESLKKEHQQINDVMTQTMKNCGMQEGDTMGLLDTMLSIFKHQEKTNKKNTDTLKQEQNRLNEEVLHVKDTNRKVSSELNITQNELAQLQQKYQELSIAYDKLHSNHDELEKECNAYKVQNQELAEKLRLSFESGQELFAAVQSLPESYTTYIGFEVKFDDLESFIISSTMKQSVLERIWDAAKNAALSNDTSSFNVLWAYFEYACELFNKGREKDIFVIDSVTEGDSYVVHDYEAVQGSASRGNIQTIYIKGFKNAYNGDRLRKSCVRV
ncbi:hypothetical protein [Veillonella sp. CHU732]|uniref:hypothetical protein n=1 Tax=Veillonella sp. CHU732 TaxID=2490949 RepID=UPI000F8E9B47|nr:hypothetical protein [Veillonella sp. CHU732]